jgi:C-1 hydroxylase
VLTSNPKSKLVSKKIFGTINGMFSMSFEENKAIIRRWFDAENKKDLSPIADIVAPDFVDQKNQLRSREEYKKWLTMFIKAFPDLHVTIEDVIAEGDKVWVRLRETATHTGEYFGLPTGNKLSYKVVAIWHIVNGKCIEGWIVYDQVDFLKQLGVINLTIKPN